MADFEDEFGEAPVAVADFQDEFGDEPDVTTDFSDEFGEPGLQQPDENAGFSFSNTLKQIPGGAIEAFNEMIDVVRPLADSIRENVPFIESIDSFDSKERVKGSRP